ncbi:ankyrin-3 isoform X3 [Triticum aestivum]|uniref:ankyrin-3 isoform X3 n=1 Tax=Triticum aestivum TaxID=4565 RepID=UPI001D00612E|nr:ankyrin-3-like isoform X3 [Triticum aestivum]
MEAPFVYLRPTVEDDGTGEQALMKAALDGNLGRLKRIVKKLTKRNGDLSAIFSINTNGCNVLHLAACEGHLEVCRYLVEELGGDVNAPGGGDVAEGATPFMLSAQSGHVSTVKYFLDHGGDLVKGLNKGRTVLHHAVCIGCCKVTEFLLSKGVPVDIDCGHGTPLYMAAINEQDKTVKILLDHHANPSIIISGANSPLMSALVYRSLKCMKLLIKLGRLPVELAAIRDCMEEVEMLFPVTSPIPNVPNWSIEGVISHAKIEEKKPIAIEHAESATLYANRSLCKLLMDDGEGALSDALMCRMLRPDWAKACYHQGAAHMLLKEYKQACDALLDAQNLDPGNAEIEGELRKARELMKNPPGKGEQ